MPEQLGPRHARAGPARGPSHRRARRVLATAAPRVEAVKSFDADLRLSRRDGDIQLAIAHKPSDALSAGDVGSQAAAIAKDLLHLADIKVLHGQDLAVAAELERMLGLGPIAADLVTGWAMAGKGRALWCVGEQLYKVQTVLHPVEAHLTYTNEAIEGAAEKFR